MPGFPTGTWLIFKCQFAFNGEHFSVIDFIPAPPPIAHTSLIFCVREKTNCCLTLNRI